MQFHHEDSAEVGSSYKGKRCGTFGDISVCHLTELKSLPLLMEAQLFLQRLETIFLANQEKSPHYYKHCEVG
jgi:dTDP-4-amino-4,6-dideoxygalactose transaminase